MDDQTVARSFDFELTRDAADGDGLTLEGYAAIFDSETVIDSWEGNFVEKIARGAFKKSLNERSPVIQFDHGRHPLVGSIPLGAAEVLREDKTGLFVRARLHDNWLIEPVRDAIKSGSISGMSFRFSVVRDSVEGAKTAKSLPVRTIQEVKLFELGPVVFPAYADTSVGVRSQEVLNALGDPEVRADLARALLASNPNAAANTRLGMPEPFDLSLTSTPESREFDGDSEHEGAADTSEPREHSDTTQITRQRRHALEQIGIR